MSLKNDELIQKKKKNNLFWHMPICIREVLTTEWQFIGRPKFSSLVKPLASIPSEDERH